jgi:hypothetical protein
MTDGQFNHAKFKKEQIEYNNRLKVKLQKAYNDVQNDKLDKSEIMIMYSELMEVLSSLIEIRITKFKEI